MFPLRDNVTSRSFPLINLTLIGINLVAFFQEIRLSESGLLESFLNTRALVPAAFWQDPWGQWPTIFYAMFLHGGWMHVIGNMWYLWIFGNSVENRLGAVGYVLFYSMSGTLAALSQTYLFPKSHIPMLGASGAIAGVLGAYFLLYPRARVLTFVPLGFFSRIVEVPAFMFLAFWFLLQAFQGVGSLVLARRYGEVGGVAWWAHAGGFVAGAVLVLFFPKKRRR